MQTDLEQQVSVEKCETKKQNKTKETYPNVTPSQICASHFCPYFQLKNTFNNKVNSFNIWLFNFNFKREWAILPKTKEEMGLNTYTEENSDSPVPHLQVKYACTVPKGGIKLLIMPLVENEKLPNYA